MCDANVHKWLNQAWLHHSEVRIHDGKSKQCMEITDAVIWRKRRALTSWLESATHGWLFFSQVLFCSNKTGVLYFYLKFPGKTLAITYYTIILLLAPFFFKLKTKKRRKKKKSSANCNKRSLRFFLHRHKYPENIVSLKTDIRYHAIL